MTKARTHVALSINGKAHEVSGRAAFANLSRYLREDLLKSGTKVVCEEGDCGSCSVLVGTPNTKTGLLDYTAINSCIAPVCSLDGCHIVTVEGLGNAKALSEVQQQMALLGGSQCGYCTPGVIVALSAMFEKMTGETSDDSPTNKSGTSLSPATVKEALTGNLCRCTGYAPIINCAVPMQAHHYQNMNARYQDCDLFNALTLQRGEALHLNADDYEFFAPTSLQNALEFKQRFPDCTVAGGYTDLGVEQNKKQSLKRRFLHLGKISQFDFIKEDNDYLLVPPMFSLSNLEDYCAAAFPDFANYLRIFASPQIKNRASLVGNLANGSPIGDSIPFLNIVDAEVELASSKGIRSEKVRNIFRGYRQLNIAGDELITAIKLPKSYIGKKFYLYKVSKRRDLDISTVTAAFYVERNKAANTISDIRMAFGGVGPVVLRFLDIERDLQGKAFTLANLQQSATQICSQIKPFSDVRGSAEFRRKLIENLIHKFHLEAEAQP